MMNSFSQHNHMHNNNSSEHALNSSLSDAYMNFNEQIVQLEYNFINILNSRLLISHQERYVDCPARNGPLEVGSHVPSTLGIYT